MANYTAADIKALREKTGAGMLDVKKALDEADGDMAKADEILRVKGLKGVTKREGRTASNGLVTAQADAGVGTLVEVLCETDFVAKGEKFVALADQVFTQAVAIRVGRRRGAAREHARRRQVRQGAARRRQRHHRREDRGQARGPPRGRARRVLPAQDQPRPACADRCPGGTAGGDEPTPRDVAMHIAAFSPSVLTRDEVDAETVENERRVAEATAKEEGKPEAALPKIVEGRVNGYFKENVLLEQPFAKEPRRPSPRSSRRPAPTANGFARFRVGG